MPGIYENEQAVDQLADEAVEEMLDRRQEVNTLTDAIYAAPLDPALQAILLKIVELAL